MITEPMTIFIVGQAVVILGALIGFFLRLNSKLSAVLTNVSWLKTQRSEQRADHEKLEEQVQGISRTVERHATILKMDDG